MLGRSHLGEVSDVDDGSTATEPTISELVTSLRSAFQKAAFTRVEEALIRREEKLKGEIEKKEEENKRLRDELHLEVLEKLKLRKECAESKELSYRLKEENDGLLKRLGESESDKKEICELKRKNCVLNCAKLNAETEVDICTGRLKVLEEKILCFEKDLEMMDRLDALNLEAENNASVVGLADTNAGTIETSQELESRNENGRVNSDAEVLPDPNPNPNPNGCSSHPKRTDTSNTAEIDTNAAVNQALDANSGKHRVVQEAESRLETGMLDSGEQSLSGKRPNASGSSSQGKRIVAKDADLNPILDSNAENRTPLSNQIIEIIDSDDEAASCKNTKGVVRKEHMKKADLRKDNDPAVHKRALACSSGVADSCPIDNGKRVKIEDHSRLTSPVDPKLSKILSEIGDDSSSSSSLDDDDVDPSLDYSTFIRTLDPAYKWRD